MDNQSGGTAEAIDCTLRRWPAPTRQADNGSHPVNCNRAEARILPIAQGRKNWLAAGSEECGKRAAAITSLLATVQTHGRAPYVWPVDVLARLPTAPGPTRSVDSLPRQA